MKSNEELQYQVQQTLQWLPQLDAATIAVTVTNGIVTLTGTVDAYSKKERAEMAAKHMPGVRALVNHLQVLTGTHPYPDDQDIASAIADAFKWRWDIPEQHLRIKVENGWVSLEGEVAWHYQREAARKTVSYLMGVNGIHNHITISPASTDAINTKDIQSALWRNAAINDDNIKVEAKGSTVILSGTVPTFFEKEEAGRMAWSAAGVEHLDNRLDVEP